MTPTTNSSNNNEKEKTNRTLQLTPLLPYSNCLENSSTLEYKLLACLLLSALRIVYCTGNVAIPCYAVRYTIAAAERSSFWAVGTCLPAFLILKRPFLTLSGDDDQLNADICIQTHSPIVVAPTFPWKTMKLWQNSTNRIQKSRGQQWTWPTPVWKSSIIKSILGFERALASASYSRNRITPSWTLSGLYEYCLSAANSIWSHCLISWSPAGLETRPVTNKTYVKVLYHLKKNQLFYISWKISERKEIG